MFLGYQNNLIVTISETREELENLPCIEFTNIVETSLPIEYINNTYYLGQENINKAKQNNIRKIRDGLLKTDVDPLVCNQLRWFELSIDDQKAYTAYRRYLLDYTNNENWWLYAPLKFNDWKSGQ